MVRPARKGLRRQMRKLQPLWGTTVLREMSVVVRKASAVSRVQLARLVSWLSTVTHQTDR